MEFVDFAQSHGLVIRELIPGRWVRTPTVDHPRSRNGAYKYLGDVGFVQNWASQIIPSIWRPENREEVRINPEAVLKRMTEEDKKREEGRRKASFKAQRILDECQTKPHAYLKSKGFELDVGNVWVHGSQNILVIPMRIGKNLVGVQLIDESGQKKFLTGQKTNDAAFTMGSGAPIFCEGYATGLSIMKCLIALKTRHSVVICFSAGNLVRLAKNGVVVADNDASETGERVAKETGLKYWMSDRLGEDFNDFHQRVGLFKATQELRKIL